MQRVQTWFTLIEILVGIVIVSFVMVIGFQSLSSVWFAKIQLIERSEIEKQAYFLSEKIFENIKRWGTIDYEEYWNRYAQDTSYTMWHFQTESWFGNFWPNGVVGSTAYGEGLYYCLSKDGVSIPDNSSCLRNFNRNFLGVTDEDKLWPQHYGQYELQFQDFNSDADNDQWDEDGETIFSFLWSSAWFIGDDDDLFRGIWPEAFPSNIAQKELYLINTWRNTRTYFRHSFALDPDAPAWANCSGTDKIIGTGCLGKIEFLRLKWEDWWYNHRDNEGFGDNDGIIDTWIIDPDFTSDSSTATIAGSDGIDYWQSLSPENIHVRDVEFYLYPNKDSEFSWRDSSSELQISPYLQIKMTLEPSWKERVRIRGEIPSVEISTTLQLLNIDIR